MGLGVAGVFPQGRRQWVRRGQAGGCPSTQDLQEVRVIPPGTASGEGHMFECSLPGTISPFWHSMHAPPPADKAFRPWRHGARAVGTICVLAGSLRVVTPCRCACHSASGPIRIGAGPSSVFCAIRSAMLPMVLRTNFCTGVETLSARVAGVSGESPAPVRSARQVTGDGTVRRCKAVAQLHAVFLVAGDKARKPARLPPISPPAPAGKGPGS